MSTTANKMIELAQSWLGYSESNGKHKRIIDIYNAHKPLARNYKVKYSDEWCATTISALAIKCNATDIIPTECSCEKMIDLMKKKGIWVENENRKPNKGDIIFYDWQDNGKGDNKGWADHVGIVERVNGSDIVVIEGNKNEVVARRVIKVNAKFIRGYGVPHYAKEDYRIAIAEYETQHGNMRYMNVYKNEIVDTNYTGYHNQLMTILTNGARGVYSSYDPKARKVSGVKLPYTKPKGTKILVRIVTKF